MKISKFSEYLNRLDLTTKRLEITEILRELLDIMSPSETDKGVYMSLGYLKATYENPKFNIAEKMMARILANAYKTDKEKVDALYSKFGDMGDVAYELAKSKDADLTITDIHKKLLELALTAGSGSQETKVAKMTKILEQLDKMSAKYVVRIVLGTTRLGFTELTIIDALNKLMGGDKATEAEIEMKYYTHPDIGTIAQKIKADGLKGLKEVGIETGVPIMPQRCQRLSDTEEIIEKMGRVSAEYKFDGTRVQLHMDRNKEDTSEEESTQNDLFSLGDEEQKPLVRTYTRNLEDNTYQYPDIVEAALKQINADSVILDGEGIGYDKDTGMFLPFQEIMQRKRKHDVAETAKGIPLRYFVFDILYLNGKTLINEPLNKRREILSSIIKPGNVIQMDNAMETEDAEELADFFAQSKAKGLEGLVIKKVDAPYQAGARAYTWVKLKRAETKLLEDTVDTVILGYYYGRGARAGFGIGGFLAGVYDPKSDTIKTITKVGTGLKDEDFRSLKIQLDKIKVSKKPANVEAGKIFEPDVWVSPKVVVELGADEVSKSETHSAGYALRFPRLLKFRTDKKPEDTTTLAEIIDMYKLQMRGSY